MEINTINYCGDDGWVYSATFGYGTPRINIPRSGDIIHNEYGDTYVVKTVIWNLPTKVLSIECSLMKN